MGTVIERPKAKPVLEGTAYGRKPQHHDPLLTEVGAGTPCGEYMRRYWHPVAVAEEVTTRPKKVRILGEDLILFRDRKGRPGLLYPRCMHRGTTLYYGRVEDRGIRCCYHGWLFDVEGRCLEQPCEPEGGIARDAARQPWYPLKERYGLVFAYMGPPDRMPVLPRFDTLEELENGEEIFTYGGAYLGYADVVEAESVPYNWLQIWENIVDPYHVYVLHSTFSTVQFAEGFSVFPQVDFEAAGRGVIYHARRTFEDGRSMDRINYAMLPTISAIPDVRLTPGRARGVQWFTPVDDTHFIGFSASVTTEPRRQLRGLPMHNGKTWKQLTEEEHQDYPGDFEAQSGQGEISLHSEEHLASSDRGVYMLRRIMARQIEIVRQGGDPLGVTFDEDEAMVQILSGNFYD